MLSPLQLAKIKSESPYTYEALTQIVTAVNALAGVLGADPRGHAAPPHAIGALSVSAANGLVDIAITDNSVVGAPLPRPINYFVEYAPNANFNGAIVVYLGPSRNAKLFLGNQTVFFRAYSQYIGSPPSLPVTFGSPPTPVAVGGPAPPPAQRAQGSGSSRTAGAGYGYSINTLAQRLTR